MPIPLTIEHIYAYLLRAVIRDLLPLAQKQDDEDSGLLTVLFSLLQAKKVSSVNGQKTLPPITIKIESRPTSTSTTSSPQTPILKKEATPSTPPPVKKEVTTPIPKKDTVTPTVVKKETPAVTSPPKRKSPNVESDDEDNIPLVSSVFAANSPFIFCLVRRRKKPRIKRRKNPHQARQRRPRKTRNRRWNHRPPHQRPRPLRLL